MPDQGVSGRAVLFDMDGTLIDSTPAVLRSWRGWAERWGVADPFASGSKHGVPAYDIAASVVAADRLEAAYVDIVATEVADTHDIVVLPGTRALLAALPADRWVIVTSCSRPLAAARIAATGLAPGQVVTADDVVAGKPAPDPFLAGAAALGIDPADCIVIEDARAGVAAGKAAGCRTIGLRTTDPDIAEAGPDLVVDDLAALEVLVAGDRIRLTAAR